MTDPVKKPMPEAARRALDEAIRRQSPRPAKLLADSNSTAHVLAGIVEPSPDDSRDYPFAASGRPPLADMDLWNLMSPIEDQKMLGSCTANATVRACESYDVRAGRYVPGVSDLSRLANYAMSRDYDDLGPGDNGAITRSALKCAQKYGLPLETVYPYDQSKVGELVLPEAVMVDAAGRKLTEYQRIATDLGDETRLFRRIDHSLAAGRPVVCAGWVMQWLRELRGHWTTHGSQRNPDNNYLIGAHAMTITGRTDWQGLTYYFADSSWTPQWGWMGRTAFTKHDLGVFFEFWSVVGFNGSVSELWYDVEQPEAKAARLYTAALGRYPDRAGLTYQTTAVAQHGLEAVAGNFVASPEFQAKYGSTTNEAFVTLLYRNVLRREPDPGGLSYHVGNLNGGQARRQLLVNFSESAENKALP